MQSLRGFRRLIFNPVWLVGLLVAIIVACGGEDPTATSAPAAEPTAAPAATAAPGEPTAMPAATTAPDVTPTTRAPAARPVSDATPTVVPTAAPTEAMEPQTAVEAKITRVRISNPPPLTENNYIWTAAWPILLQHEPYGESLLQNDEVTSEPRPLLATSWEMSNGFRNWKFDLAEGVQWHFGWGEFTSADVAHTHMLQTQEEAAGNFKGLWVDGTPNIIDDHTIEFVFDPPMVDGLRLFSRLAGDLIIQSKAQWDAGGGVPAAYDDMPAGTGSYQYGGRRLGESIWYEKIEGEHWNGENPDFQELEWVWASEQFTRLSQLLAGEVQGADLAREVQPQAINAGMTVVSSNNENNQSYGIFGGSFLSTDNPYYNGPIPWHDVRVREAMNRAIDREAIIEEIYDNRATPVVVPLYAPFTEGWNDSWVEEFDDRYGYDPQRSIELLAEAGYAPGEVEIESWSTVIPGNPEIPQLLEIMSTMWEAAGFSTKIQEWDFGIWLEKLTEHDYYEKFIIGRNTPIRTTQEGLRIFFSSEPHGFIYGFEHDLINENYNCLRESVDADEREACARIAGDFIYEQYAMVPLFQITFDMTIDPEFISEWQYPGVGSAHPTHSHNIRACPVGTDRCE